MTAKDLEELVRFVDLCHVGLVSPSVPGNVVLLDGMGGQISMIPGALSNLSPGPLTTTLLETFGIDPERITAPEQLFVGEVDIDIARRQKKYWPGQ